MNEKKKAEAAAPPTRLERLLELARRQPDAAFPLYGLAMEYKGKNQNEDAAASFASLLEKHPDYTPAFLHYGTLLFEMGRSEEAVEVMKRGIAVCSQRGEQHAREELQAALEQLGP